jgi:hypothetical protein
VLVIRAHDHAVCPTCSAPLAAIWRSAEDTAIEAALTKLEAICGHDLARVLQTELMTLRDLVLRCN